MPLAWLWGGLALGLAWRGRPPGPWGLLLIALAARLPLIGTPALLSDDLFRYLWEGQVIAQGINPLLHAPASLPRLDDALLARVNHPDIPSAYPPLALGWFWLLHQLGGQPWIAQAATAAVDIALVMVLARASSTAPSRAALLYAAHPLPALESAASAHLDVLAVALASLALLRGSRLAGLGTVLGMGTKLLPALWLPVVLRRGPRAWQGAAAGLAGLLLAALPLLAGGSSALDGLRSYATRWSFAGLGFGLLQPWLGAHTRPLLLLLGVFAVGWILWQRRGLAWSWMACATAFLLLSPTVHPWYGLWALAPSLHLGRRAWAIGGVSLLSSYLVLATLDPSTGSWREPGWLAPLVWLPILIALLWEARHHRSSRSAQPPDPRSHRPPSEGAGPVETGQRRG